MINGANDGNRTFDPLIKSQLLYRLSYRDIDNLNKKWLGHLGSNQGNDRVKVCCLTAWLCPTILKKNGGEGQIRTAEPVGN